MVFREPWHKDPNDETINNKGYVFSYWFEDMKHGPFFTVEKAIDDFISKLSMASNYNEADLPRKLIQSMLTFEALIKELTDENKHLTDEVIQLEWDLNNLTSNIDSLKKKYGA